MPERAVPSSALILLVVAAGLHVAAFGAEVAPNATALSTATAGVAVLVGAPALAALAALRRARGADAAVVGLGVVAAGRVAAGGLAGLVGRGAGPDVLTLVAYGATALAAAAQIARWQDTAAPPGGGRLRWVRLVLALAGLTVALTDATAPVAIVDAVISEGRAVPDIVGVATSLELTRAPSTLALVGVALWGARRVDPPAVRAVALALLPTALLGLLLDVQVARLTAPSAVGLARTAAVALLVIVAARPQGASAGDAEEHADDEDDVELASDVSDRHGDADAQTDVDARKQDEDDQASSSNA